MVAAKKAVESAPAEEPKAEDVVEEAASERAVDRVAAVSYRADGTPDQTEGFEVIDPEA